MIDTIVFVGRRGHGAGRGARRGAAHQPGALRPELGAHAVRRRGALRHPERQLPGRGPGHRLRRRGRGAVPVRDHAVRRRPRRGTGGRAPRRPAHPGRRLRHRGAGPHPHRCLGRLAGSPARSRWAARSSSTEPDINQLARSLFSNYVFAFEITAVLLVVAVVGTVVLARRPPREVAPDEGERPVQEPSS